MLKQRVRNLVGSWNFVMGLSFFSDLRAIVPLPKVNVLEDYSRRLCQILSSVPRIAIRDDYS